MEFERRGLVKGWLVCVMCNGVYDTVVVSIVSIVKNCAPQSECHREGEGRLSYVQLCFFFNARRGV